MSSSSSSAATTTAAASNTSKTNNTNEKQSANGKSHSAATTTAPPVVLVTGASRGIGWGLVGEFAKAGYRVIAAARNPNTAKQLNDFAKTNSNVQVAPLDVSDEKSIRALPALLAAPPFSLTQLDVLVNNAGIAGNTSARLSNASPASFREIFETNLVGPFLVTQLLTPLLRVSTNARVINVSSALGSIKLAQDAAFFPFVVPAYRVSKAALNMLSALQASEFNFGLTPPSTATPAVDATVEATKGLLPPGPQLNAPGTNRVTVVAWHPGYVASDMGKSSGGNPPVSVEQCAATIVPVVHSLKPSSAVIYLDADAKTVLPW